MRKLFTIAVAILMSFSVLAQAPQGFTYQAVVRNDDGTPLAHQIINVRIDLLRGSATGNTVYAELHTPTTDANGLFTVIVGQGVGLVNCPFEDCIDWANGPYWLKSQVSPDSGNSYTIATTQQLMSVPYALFSAQSANVGTVDAQHLSDSLSEALRQYIDNVAAGNMIHDTLVIHTSTTHTDSVIVYRDTMSIADEFESMRDEMHDYIDSIAVGTMIHDTLLIHDTVIIRDSVVIYVHDSTVVHDSVFIHDSVVVNIIDSTVVHIRDSVIVHLHDSIRVYLHDSLVYDTIHLHPYDSSPADTEGALPGVFSISVANRVAFSRGNLQYKASTSTWRFAEHQYDMVGTANIFISSTYDGWIDLFGFGTSGYNNKYPYLKSTENSSYVNSTIAGTNYDWGIYNAISNGGDSAGIWRTLSSAEWDYIITGRANASDLRATATVFGIPGLILLPDGWGEEEGLPVTITSSDFTTNTFTAEEWILLETAGAVFLPACGWRTGASLYEVGNMGCYWSTTYGYDGNTGAFRLRFSTEDLSTFLSSFFAGCSVRLVHDLTTLP